MIRDRIVSHLIIFKNHVDVHHKARDSYTGTGHIIGSYSYRRIRSDWNDNK